MKFSLYKEILAESKKMVSRIEPRKFDSSAIHERCLEIFERKQWIPFFEKFDGYNGKVILEFSRSFDGERDTIGNFSFMLSEDILAQITGLPKQEQRFLKKTV